MRRASRGCMCIIITVGYRRHIFAFDILETLDMYSWLIVGAPYIVKQRAFPERLKCAKGW